MVHPKSMNFQNQRKVFVLRSVKDLPWAEIASSVKNRQNHHPSERQCREVYASFNQRLGRRTYKYSNCGRTPWKVTKDVEKFIVQKLKALRSSCVCTSATLQRELLREKRVRIDCSTIRKVLQRNGFHWLRRSQKPKYSKDDKQARVAFCREALEMTQAELNKYVTMSMDGVVLSVPPADPVDRENYCKVGETHMWRTKDEGEKEDLSGGTKYEKQFTGSRAVPLWGGIGPGGFGVVMFHAFRKVDQEEWSAAVASGKLAAACRACRPDRRRGPWRILCDNESFLSAGKTRAAHARARVELWHIPARSPDLNPIEMYWSWLRKRLRAMDLDDLRNKRPPVQKFGLKMRVHALLRTTKAKQVAKNCWGTFRSKCLECVRKRGAAIRS